MVWFDISGAELSQGSDESIWSFVDISAQKIAEEKLLLSASVFSNAREGIVITSHEAKIIDVNDAFTRITGYSRLEVIGKSPSILRSCRHGRDFYTSMWRTLIEKSHWYGEVWNRRRSGEVYVEMLNITAVRNQQGKAINYVGIFTDITALKDHQGQLEHIAHYDALTSLPNRVLLADRLRQGMSQVQRRGKLLALAFLDLDGFKVINDRYGHEAGDILLTTVATRLNKTLRDGDTLSRLGGDEFIVVILDLPDFKASEPMLMRLLAAAAETVLVDGVMLNVSASIGVSFYPQTEGIDPDQLMRQADQAMYQAKQSGKNCFHFFDIELDRSVRGHHESMENIRSAIAANEFVLYYQPKVNMRTGFVIGAEALIRWQHPDKGLLPPSVFLPVIEGHSLAVQLGEWVIDTALTEMCQWRTAGLDIPVSVNIGGRHLQQSDFVQKLIKILARHPDVRHGDLELEVLETTALEDLAQISSVIKSCAKIGVNFALDDFGTGYSSLTYLKRLPVTILKIDQSFVRGVLDDRDDLSILESVLGLATAFRRQAIAEGVETIEHGERLLQLGCELAQGYGIARPMPAHELPAWSMAWRPFKAWLNLAPLNRDDFPLLYASVEHRSWISAIEGYLKGECDAPPPLDHHQCRFGVWLDQCLTRHDVEANFDAIDIWHQRVHSLALNMCDLNSRGLVAEVQLKLDQLYGLRDALDNMVRDMLNHIASGEG